MITRLDIVPTQPQHDLTRYLLHKDVRRFIACWQMGVGKTPLAILFCETNLHYRYPGQTIEPRLCIVVAAPTMQQNFRDNLKKFGKSEQDIDTWYRFWSYDLVASRPYEFKKLVTNNIVVCDEVHDIRSVIVHGGSKTSGVGTDEVVTFRGFSGIKAGIQAASLLWGIETAYKVLGMTGTLIYNSLSDLYNIGWFLLSASSEESKTLYGEMVKVSDLENNKINDNALKMFEHVFQGKLSVCTIESCGLSHKFPKVHEINVLIEMNAEYYEAYTMVENDEIEKLREKNETKLVTSGAFWSSLRQAANKINSVQSQKLQFIVEIVKATRARREKIVITSSFLSRGLGLLINEFRAHNWRFCEISGKVKPEERQKAIESFNNMTSGIDIIILSGAGTTGVNLASARRQINMESSWNTATRWQANARIARLGSPMAQVTIYNLLMVKPGDQFESFAEQMKQCIKEKEPGAPSDLIKIAAGNTTNITMGPSKLVMSIDAHLFLKQLDKSRAFHPFLDVYLPQWSVEQHPAWQNLLKGCVPIDSFLNRGKKNNNNNNKNKEQKEQKERKTKERKTKEKKTKQGRQKHNINNEKKTSDKTTRKHEQKRELLLTAWQKEFGIRPAPSPSSSSSSSSSSSLSSSFVSSPRSTTTREAKPRTEKREQKLEKEVISFNRRQWLADLNDH